MLFSKKTIFCVIVISSIVYPKENDEGIIKEIEIGNFALPGSQRLSPSLGVGQNIVDKNTFMGFLSLSSLQGKHKNYVTVIPEVLYGITNDLSIFIGFPVAAQSKYGNLSSSGINDFLAQLEYAVYHKSKSTSAVYATILGTMFFPTGNVNKQPPTGYGSPSFLLGFTLSRLTIDWYYYTSYAGFLTTKHKNIKFGNHFIYQAGLGKNIAYSTHKWLLSWLFEISGTYEQKSKVLGIADINTGGHNIFFGFSLWFSTQDFILECTAAPTVYQHNNGIQLKNHLLLSLLLGWKFN